MNKSEIEKAKIAEIIAAMPAQEQKLCRAMIDSLLMSVGHPVTGNTFMMAIAAVNTEMAVTLIKLGIVNEDGSINSPLQRAEKDAAEMRKSVKLASAGRYGAMGDKQHPLYGDAKEAVEKPKRRFDLAGNVVRSRKPLSTVPEPSVSPVTLLGDVSPMGQNHCTGHVDYDPGSVIPNDRARAESRILPNPGQSIQEIMDRAPRPGFTAHIDGNIGQVKPVNELAEHPTAEAIKQFAEWAEGKQMKRNTSADFHQHFDNLAPNRVGRSPERIAHNVKSHICYKTGDANAPEVIKDRNGEVVLSLCIACGAGESELAEESCSIRRIRLERESGKSE